MLTIQIVTKNNQRTIERTIQSLLNLEGQIVIGDIGSSDDTLEICRRYRAKIINIPWENDYSKARNRLLTDDWNLIIEPWEVFADGYDEIRKPKKPGVFELQIFNNNIITKETRYWHGDEIKFQYPVFETITAKADPIAASIAVVDEPDRRQERLKLAQKWLNREPTKTEPHYYVAMGLLSLGMYRQFIGVAEQYLLKDSSSKSGIMTRYYMAHVLLHCLGDSKSAGKCILTCISAHPLMAEFWCLLGDLYYHQKKYDKAIAFYENAIILGSKRSNEDGWPIEIAKYKEYPTKLIENAKQIRTNTKAIGAR